MELKDKKVILTGGAKGIGYEIARHLINEGAYLGILDIDFSRKSFQSIKKSSKIFLSNCDVTNKDAVKDSVDQYFDKYGEIDVLINNAGIIYNEPLIIIKDRKLIKHDLKMWHKVISNDLDSVFIVTMEVVEKMILKRTKGVILNISSISADGNAGQSAYSAAKAGVNALTSTWAKELGHWGIRVNGIAPGFCDTESTKQNMKTKALDQLRSQIPLKRLGHPAEIAAGVISILKNNYINGKTIGIDGGLSI